MRYRAAMSPVDLVVHLYETAGGGRVFAIDHLGVTRKILFDLDGDGVIEAEVFDPDGDGVFDAARRARLPIPPFLFPGNEAVAGTGGSG
jgi:hypothetical protein